MKFDLIFCKRKLKICFISILLLISFHFIINDNSQKTNWHFNKEYYMTEIEGIYFNSPLNFSQELVSSSANSNASEDTLIILEDTKYIFSEHHIIIEQQSELASYSSDKLKNNSRIIDYNLIIILDNFNFLFKRNELLMLFEISDKDLFKNKGKDVLYSIEKSFLMSVSTEKENYINNGNNILNKNGISSKEKRFLNNKENLLSTMNTGTSEFENNEKPDMSSISEYISIIENQCIYFLTNNITKLVSSRNNSNKENYKYSDNSNQSLYNQFYFNLNQELAFELNSVCFSDEKDLEKFVSKLRNSMKRILNDVVSGDNKTFFYRMNKHAEYYKHENDINNSKSANNDYNFNKYNNDNNFLKPMTNNISQGVKEEIENQNKKDNSGFYNKSFDVDNNFAYQKIMVKIAEINDTNDIIDKILVKNIRESIYKYNKIPKYINDLKKDNLSNYSSNLSLLNKLKSELKLSNEKLIKKNSYSISVNKLKEHLAFRNAFLDLSNIEALIASPSSDLSNISVSSLNNSLNSNVQLAYNYDSIINCSTVKLSKNDLMIKEEMFSNNINSRNVNFNDKEEQCCLAFNVNNPNISLFNTQKIIICSLIRSDVECNLEIKYIQSKISENCSIKLKSNLDIHMQRALKEESSLYENIFGSTISKSSSSSRTNATGTLITNNFSKNYIYSRYTDIIIQNIINNRLDPNFIKLLEANERNGSDNSQYFEKTFIDDKTKIKHYLQQLVFSLGDEYKFFIHCGITHFVNKDALTEKALSYELIIKYFSYLNDSFFNNEKILSDFIGSKMNVESTSFNQHIGIQNCSEFEYYDVFGSINKNYYKIESLNKDFKNDYNLNDLAQGKIGFHGLDYNSYMTRYLLSKNMSKSYCDGGKYIIKYSPFEFLGLIPFTNLNTENVEIENIENSNSLNEKPKNNSIGAFIYQDMESNKKQKESDNEKLISKLKEDIKAKKKYLTNILGNGRTDIAKDFRFKQIVLESPPVISEVITPLRPIVTPALSPLMPFITATPFLNRPVIPLTSYVPPSSHAIINSESNSVFSNIPSFDSKSEENNNIPSNSSNSTMTENTKFGKVITKNKTPSKKDNSLKGNKTKSINNNDINSIEERQQNSIDKNIKDTKNKQDPISNNKSNKNKKTFKGKSNKIKNCNPNKNGDNNNNQNNNMSSEMNQQKNSDQDLRRSITNLKLSGRENKNKGCGNDNNNNVDNRNLNYKDNENTNGSGNNYSNDYNNANNKFNNHNNLSNTNQNIFYNDKNDNNHNFDLNNNNNHISELSYNSNNSDLNNNRKNLYDFNSNIKNYDDFNRNKESNHNPNREIYQYNSNNSNIRNNSHLNNNSLINNNQNNVPQRKYSYQNNNYNYNSNRNKNYKEKIKNRKVSQNSDSKSNNSNSPIIINIYPTNPSNSNQNNKVEPEVKDGKNDEYLNKLFNYINSNSSSNKDKPKRELSNERNKLKKSNPVQNNTTTKTNDNNVSQNNATTTNNNTDTNSARIKQ